MDAVAVRDDVALAVADAVFDDKPVAVLVCELVDDAVFVPLIDPLGDVTGVAVDEKEFLSERDDVGALLSLTSGRRDGDDEADSVSFRVARALAVVDTELDTVLVTVGVALTEEVAELVRVLVEDAVPVFDPVLVRELVADDELDLVAEIEPVVVPVFVPVAFTFGDGDGEADTDGETSAELVDDRDTRALADTDCVTAPLRVGTPIDFVAQRLARVDAVTVFVASAVGDTVELPVALALADVVFDAANDGGTDADGRVLADSDADADVDRVTLADAVTVAESVAAVRFEDAVGSGADGVGDARRDSVGRTETVTVRETAAVPDPDNVPVAVADAVPLAVALALADDVAACVCV